MPTPPRKLPKANTKWRELIILLQKPEGLSTPKAIELGYNKHALTKVIDHLRYHLDITVKVIGKIRPNQYSGNSFCIYRIDEELDFDKTY